MDDQTFPVETTRKHESKKKHCNGDEIIHNLLTLSGFSGANRLSSGTAKYQIHSQVMRIVFTV